MKESHIYGTFIFLFLTIASCGNQNAPADHPLSKDSTLSMPAMHKKKDTSRFNLSMVDNKKDFVCRMPLTAGIGDTVHYKGKVYGFCSKECKASFQKDPKGYLAENKNK